MGLKTKEKQNDHSKIHYTQRYAYAMVTGDSSEIDRVFSLAQAQTMRKFMSKEKEWEQVDP